MAGLVGRTCYSWVTFCSCPVFEGPVYSSLSSELTTKLTGCVGTIDLWRKLFEYDELTINMRQKDEKEFSRVRLGYVTSEDITLLEK